MTDETATALTAAGQIVAAVYALAVAAGLLLDRLVIDEEVDRG